MKKQMVTAMIAAAALAASAADLAKQVKADFADYSKRAFVHYAVPPTSDAQRLADAYPYDGVANGTVKIFAAKGEYEPGAFEVWGVKDLGKVKFELGEFKQGENEKGEKIGGGGVIFPKANLDLKVVKSWYQNLNAWFSYFGDAGDYKLCPELLLNDEDLIRIDEKTKSNYARLTDANGKKVAEHWINAPRAMEKTGSHFCGNNYWTAFQAMAPGFDDAKTLMPVAIAKNAFKCLYLTAHVTPEIPAGVYRGEILVLKNGQETRDKRQEGQSQILGTIPVEIHVADYTLPHPKCYREPERDFLVNFYNYNNIYHLQDLNGGDYELAVKQLEPMIRDMAAHGQSVFQFFNMGLGHFYIQELCVEAGMRPDVFFGGPMFWTPTREKRLAECRLAADEYDRRFGCHNVYCTCGDEPGCGAPSGFVSDLVKYIEEWHSIGFKHYIAGREWLFQLGGFAFDWLNVDEEPTVTNSHLEKWNAVPDKRCAWYAKQHCGVENPALNRRQSGLPSWLAGYTCFANYAHHPGPYCDESGFYKPMVFAYGAHSGMIDTVQWEGFREGIDDIRYATLLCELARKALKSSDVQAQFAGGKAFQYLALLNHKDADLETARAEMRRLIANLLVYVKQDAVVPLKRLPPKPQAADAALAKELAPLRAKYDAAHPEKRGYVTPDMAAVYRKYYRHAELADILEKQGDLLEAAKAAAETFQFERAEKLREKVMNDPKQSRNNRNAAAWTFAFSRPEIWNDTNLVAILEANLTGQKDFYMYRHGWVTYAPLSSSGLHAERFDRGWACVYRSVAKNADALKLTASMNPNAFEHGIVVFNRLGDQKDLADLCRRRLADEKLKGAARYDAGLIVKLFGDVALRGSRAKKAADILAAYEKENLTKEMKTEERMNAINHAGRVALMLHDNETARALENYRAALYKPVERRRYTVRFSETPIEGVDWTGVNADVALCDRKYGGSTELMYTDVSTGVRKIADEKDKAAKKEPMRLQIAADAWGIHIRCESTDPKADEIATGRYGGGSIESYLAPGKNKPYTCLLKSDNDAKWSCWNTCYDAIGQRYLPTDDARRIKSHTRTRDGKIVNMVSISWDFFCDDLPKDGSVWDYEAFRWGADDCAWNGSRSIHERSTWGELVFALTPAERAKIVRRAEETAYAYFRRETQQQPWNAYYIGRGLVWTDPNGGDPAFYEARVKPWAAQLLEEGKVLGEGASDATVLRLEANGTLSKWHNVIQHVDRMRRDWLER